MRIALGVEYDGAAFFGCPQFVQDAAVYALTHDEPQVAAMREEYRRRRDYAVARIAAIEVPFRMGLSTAST